MPQQPYYAETPFERIVDVHWRKKEDCPPPRAAAPHYNGFYGYGLACTGSSFAGYGEHQYPGCIGFSDFFSPNIISGHDCGSVYNYHYMPEEGYGGVYLEGNAYTGNLSLRQSVISFTNNELYYGTFAGSGQPELPAIFWGVPMGGGETYLGCFGSGQNIFAPWVPLVYHLSFQWDYAGESGRDLGLSFTPAGMVYQPEPHFNIGSYRAGIFTYGYQTHFWEWFVEDFTRGHHYTDQTAWNFGIGGPVDLWWHTSGGEGGGWRPVVSSIVLEMGLSVNGDTQTWEVVAECGDAFGAGDIGGPAAAAQVRAQGPRPRLFSADKNDHRLIRPGPPLCSETSGLRYPPLKPGMLETIRALEQSLERERQIVKQPRRFPVSPFR